MSANIAEQLEENEQYDKAYEEYKKAHAQNPKSIDILERLGHLAVMLDKSADAIEHYNKILELDSTSVLAYEQLMDLYMHSDRYKYYISRGNLHIVQEELSHAMNDFKKALNHAQTEPESNSTRFVLANLYEQTGKPHQAIDEYLRIIDTGNVNEFVYLKLAQVYLSENSVTSAIETLERARENGYDIDNVKETLAQIYLQNNQPEKARILSNNDLIKVKSLLEEEKNAAAFEILDKIKAENIKNAQYHSLLAQYYFNVKDWENSLESIDEFDKLEQNSPLTYQMRALVNEEKGNDFDAHINWAKYSLSRRDKDVALNEYFSAYQVKDNDSELVKNIAELIEDMGDKTHAAEFWEKLVNLDSKNKKALEKVAEFKENIGDYRSEAEMLEKLYAIDDKNSVAVKKLAKSYERIKNKEKALEYYNRYISISPVNEEYEQIKTKIRKLETSEFEEDAGLLGKFMGFFNKK